MLNLLMTSWQLNIEDKIFRKRKIDNKVVYVVNTILLYIVGMENF